MLLKTFHRTKPNCRRSHVQNMSMSPLPPEGTNNKVDAFHNSDVDLNGGGNENRHSSTSQTCQH